MLGYKKRSWSFSSQSFVLLVHDVVLLFRVVSLSQNLDLSLLNWGKITLTIVCKEVNLDLICPVTPGWFTLSCVMIWTCEAPLQTYEVHCINVLAEWVSLYLKKLWIYNDHLKLEDELFWCNKLKPSQNIYRHINTFLLIARISTFLIGKLLHLQKLLLEFEKGFNKIHFFSLEHHCFQKWFQ